MKNRNFLNNLNTVSIVFLILVLLGSNAHSKSWYQKAWNGIKNGANTATDFTEAKIVDAYDASGIEGTFVEDWLITIGQPYIDGFVILENAYHKTRMVDDFNAGNLGNIALQQVLDMEAVALAYGVYDELNNTNWNNVKNDMLNGLENVGEHTTDALKAYGYAQLEAAMWVMSNLYSGCIWAVNNSQYAASPILVAEAAGLNTNVDLFSREDAITICNFTGIALLHNAMQSLVYGLDNVKELLKIVKGDKSKWLDMIQIILDEFEQEARNLLATPLVSKFLINNKKMDELESQNLTEAFEEYSSIADLRSSIQEPVDYSFHTKRSSTCGHIAIPAICNSDGSDLNTGYNGMTKLRAGEKAWLHAVLVHAFGPAYWYKDTYPGHTQSLADRTQVITEFENRMFKGSASLHANAVPYIVNDTILAGSMGAVLYDAADSIILLNERLFDPAGRDEVGNLTDKAIELAKLTYIEELFQHTASQICKEVSNQFKLCTSSGGDAGAQAADAVNEFSTNFNTFVNNIHDNAGIHVIAGRYEVDMNGNTVTLETKPSLASVNTFLNNKKGANLRLRSQIALQHKTGMAGSKVVLDFKFDWPRVLKPNTGLADFYEGVDTDNTLCSDYNCRAILLVLNVAIHDKVYIGTPGGDTASLGVSAGVGRSHSFKIPFVLKSGSINQWDSGVTNSNTKFSYSMEAYGEGAAKFPKFYKGLAGKIFVKPYATYSASWNSKASNKIAKAVASGAVGAVGGCIGGAIAGVATFNAGVESCVFGSQFYNTVITMSIAEDQNSKHDDAIKLKEEWGVKFGTSVGLESKLESIDNTKGTMDLRIELVKPINSRER